MIINKVKVFSKKNIPFKIQNNIEELCSIIEESPVVAEVDGHRDVIGFVKDCYSRFGDVYGNVYIYPRYYEYNQINVTNLEINFDYGDKNDYIIIKYVVIYVEKCLTKINNLV